MEAAEPEVVTIPEPVQQAAPETPEASDAPAAWKS